ncbi:PTS lactose transporter subunit IIB [Sphaerisporangium sp. NPDC051017]|uniref:PTS lactose transporter subunit IIB n=1 Tax=unclassified Sphaerisporangium TaxID=2630420 RepID=UPI0033DA43B0
MAAIDSKDIHKLIVACDAGMGSSVMLATQLRKQLKSTGITVEHTPVNEIPKDTDLVVCHIGLAARAKAVAPGVPLVTFQIFIGDPAVTKLVAAIKNGGTVDA